MVQSPDKNNWNVEDGMTVREHCLARLEESDASLAISDSQVQRFMKRPQACMRTIEMMIACS